MVERDSFSQLAHLIAAVNRRLEADMASDLADDGTPPDFLRVLEALTAQDGQPMQRLADAVLMNPTTLTKTIDRMVAQALVYRAPDPEDRRRVLIFLSDHGRSVEARLREAAALRTRRLSQNLDPEDARRIADALRTLL
jgi:DNA-binding MarR family transcriptional regulator